MAVCYDTTGIIYSFLNGMTNNVTGSLEITILLISIFFMAIAAGFFKMQLEITMIVLLPLHLAFLACIGTSIFGVVGTILIYLGILLAKNFFFR